MIGILFSGTINFLPLPGSRILIKSCDSLDCAGKPFWDTRIIQPNRRPLFTSIPFSVSFRISSWPLKQTSFSAKQTAIETTEPWRHTLTEPQSPLRCSSHRLSCIAGPVHQKVVVCYIGTWSVYRPGAGSFSLDNFDPSLCTHVIYAFAGLDEEKNTIKSLGELLK